MVKPSIGWSRSATSNTKHDCAGVPRFQLKDRCPPGIAICVLGGLEASDPARSAAEPGPMTRLRGESP
jgi:hypothetical protein